MMEGISFVTQITGLKRHNTRYDDTEDYDEEYKLKTIFAF
jgi:hypothetical protein